MPLLPLLTGVTTHLAVRPFEIDRYMFTIIFACFISFISIFAKSQYLDGFSIGDSLSVSCNIALEFITGFFGSLFIYRVFFHRLHRFPGPFFAKVTRFYAFKTAVTTLQLHIAAEKNHEKYGDFVRAGPREISIKRASAVGLIYGPNSKCYRSAEYDNPSSDPAKSSVVGTRDPDAHKRRKRAWERGLGFKALSIYEPRLSSKVDLFLSRMSSHEGTPFDVTELCKFFGFDAMGEVGYSKDFDMLKSGTDHVAIAAVREQMVTVATLICVPWLFILLLNFMNLLERLGVGLSFNVFLDWCSKQVVAKRKIIHDEKESGVLTDPQDVMSWLIKAQDEGDSSAPPGENAIQEDSRVLIVAGSDTTSVALANSFYYLAKNPAVYQKLQDILDTEFPGGESEWTYAKAKSILYLDGIIHETLRLRPSVPGGLNRVTPPEGLQIDEVFIPGDTNVRIPTYAIQRDSRYWFNPLEFRPERWETLTPEKTPFLSFTRGKYLCPGKGLAMMEMVMVISRVTLRYDIGCLEQEVADRFENETLDTFTMSVPPLPLIFTRR